jgi:hypothetical protein
MCTNNLNNTANHVAIVFRLVLHELDGVVWCHFKFEFVSIRIRLDRCTLFPNKFVSGVSGKRSVRKR